MVNGIFMYHIGKTPTPIHKADVVFKIGDIFLPEAYNEDLATLIRNPDILANRFMTPMTHMSESDVPFVKTRMSSVTLR